MDPRDSTVRASIHRGRFRNKLASIKTTLANTNPRWAMWDPSSKPSKNNGMKVAARLIIPSTRSSLESANQSIEVLEGCTAWKGQSHR
jgi:hypothetical protein